MSRRGEEKYKNETRGQHFILRAHMHTPLLYNITGPLVYFANKNVHMRRRVYRHFWAADSRRMYMKVYMT